MIDSVYISFRFESVAVLFRFYFFTSGILHETGRKERRKKKIEKRERERERRERKKEKST